MSCETVIAMVSILNFGAIVSLMILFVGRR